MSRDPELRQQLKRMVEKSRRALNSAAGLHKDGHHDDAASRAYYAVFHILQTLLLTEGLTYSKHLQVLGAFNREFIHKGLFPNEFYKIIERLFEDRRIGDYEYDEGISLEESERDIRDAEIVVNCIVEYLRSEGFTNGEQLPLK